VHLIGYADGINIMGRKKITIYEVYEELKERSQ